MWFSASGRTNVLVSDEVVYPDMQGITPSEGVKVKRPPSLAKLLTYNQPELGNGAR